MNHWFGRGNLGSDAVIRSSNGVTFANFSIAINQRGKDKKPYTDWFRIVAFNKLAETLHDLRKGDEVLVAGSLHRTTFTKDGVEYRDVEVRARTIEFLRRKSRDGSASSAEDASPEAPDETSGAGDPGPSAPPDLEGAGDGALDDDLGQEFPDPAAEAPAEAPTRRSRWSRGGSASA